MKTLEVLVGLIIKKSETMHDYLQLTFSDGSILSVFNNYVSDTDISDFKSEKIISIKESPGKIVISTQGGNVLTIGISDEDYNGPEALVLKHGTSIVVIN